MRELAGKLAEGALFAAGQCLVLALITLLACLIGRRLAARVEYHSRLEAFAFSLALGLGAISYIIMLLGLVGRLERWTLFGALAAAALVSAVNRLPKPRRTDYALRLAPLSAILAVVLLPMMALALYPPVAWDATAYHLAAAKIYVDHHALVFTPYLRFPVFPQVNHMLFAGALMAGGETLAQQLQLLMTSALAAAMIAFSRRYLTARAGWWAAALLFGMPLLVWLGVSAYVDAGLIFYLFLSCHAFMNYRAGRSMAWLVVAGVCGGLAVGIKYTALFFILALGLWSLWSKGGRSRLMPPIIYCGTAFLAVAPWLARNIYYAGNPLFPFFTSLFTRIFGERQVPAADFATMNESSMSVGIGRSLKSLVSLPWELATNQDAFIPEAPISLLFMVLLPLALLPALRRREMRVLLLIALGYTLFWFFNYQIVRYLLPAFPIYCLLVGGGLDAALSRFDNAHRRADRRADQRADRRRWLTVIVGLLLVAPGWWFALGRVKQNGRIPVNSGQRDIYLQLAHESYPLYKVLNERTGGRYRLFALYDRHMTCFADGEFLGDWYGPARYDRVTRRMATGEELLGALGEMRVDFLLVNFALGDAKLPDDETFRQRFRLLFRRERAALYDLRNEPFSVQTGANLLVNAVAGEEREVKLPAGRYYRFGFTARESAQGRALLQVKWLDERGERILIDRQLCDVSSAGARYEIDFLAPASAAAALVSIAPVEASELEYDEVFFGELILK